MKTFKQVLKDHGFSLKEASARGIPYDTLAKHAQGVRRVGAFSATRYEMLLGIPRWELRPDLWPEDAAAPGPSGAGPDHGEPGGGTHAAALDADKRACHGS